MKIVTRKTVFILFLLAWPAVCVAAPAFTYKVNVPITVQNCDQATLSGLTNVIVAVDFYDANHSVIGRANTIAPPLQNGNTTVQVTWTNATAAKSYKAYFGGGFPPGCDHMKSNIFTDGTIP